LLNGPRTEDELRMSFLNDIFASLTRHAEIAVLQEIREGRSLSV